MKAVKMLLGAVIALAVLGVTEVRAEKEWAVGIEKRGVYNVYPTGSVDFNLNRLFPSITSPCAGGCRLFGQVRGDKFGLHVALGDDAFGTEFTAAIIQEDRRAFLPQYVLDFLGMMTFGERVKDDVRLKGVGMFGLSLLESVKYIESSICPYRCIGRICDNFCSGPGHDVDFGVKIAGGVDILFRENWMGEICVEYADYAPFQNRDFAQLALVFRFGYRF